MTSLTVKDMVRTLKEAMAAKRLVFTHADERPEIEAMDDEGRYFYAKKTTPFQASVELLALLAALVDPSRGHKLEILSLFRTVKAGPHGILQTDGKTRLGRAVDIRAYAGNLIDLAHPTNAAAARTIQGVARVIERLPAGKFTLGLPRPGLGGSHRDPDNDVFLPATERTVLRTTPTGSFAGDLACIVKPEAKQALARASRSNPAAKILFMYPDANNHLHVKACDWNDKQ
jgi:hypothetical protein